MLWRGLALGAAAAGAIWAARCLGPGNMGISGMILSTANQLAILIDLRNRILRLSDASRNAATMRNVRNWLRQSSLSDLFFARSP